MANTREIKRRIRAVDNIQQITKAMEMVSAAKLRRAQDNVLAARPYSERLELTLQRLSNAGVALDHPLLQKPKSNKLALAVIAGDRGLAGSYNANILRHASKRLQEHDDVMLIPIGRRVLDYFRRRSYEMGAAFVNIGEEASFSKAEEIADYLMSLFVEGQVGEVRLVYTQFVSAITQRTEEMQLLPLPQPEASQQGQDAAEYIFVPSAEGLLKELLPKLVKNQVFRALLESKASEHGARMTAMRSASDNAVELIDSLTLQFNRARQAAITTEISEIVGGAEALSS